MHPEKRQLFIDMSLSQNTIAYSVSQHVANSQNQLVKNRKYFISLLLAVGKSTNNLDSAQLSIFIHAVHSSLYPTAVIWGFTFNDWYKSKEDVFEEMFRCTSQMGMAWDKLEGLTIDGVPTMCCHKSEFIQGSEKQCHR